MKKVKICPKGRSLNPNTLLTVFPYAKATFLRGTPLKANTIRKYYNNTHNNKNNNNNNNRHRNYTMHTFKPRYFSLAFRLERNKRGMRLRIRRRRRGKARWRLGRRRSRRVCEIGETQLRAGRPFQEDALVARVEEEFRRISARRRMKSRGTLYVSSQI